MIEERNNQFSGWAEKEFNRDYLKRSERGGELVGVAAVGLIALFFYMHQAWSTGFFTSRFGPTEAFFFYGSIMAGIVGPLFRSATGRRNLSRLPEMIASVLWMVGAVWLLIVFPFNFAHLGDVVPTVLRFLLAWITNDIARVLFTLGALGGVVFTIVNASLYWKVDRLLRQHDEAH
ncbi:hypothetical protein [Nitrososphaera viennensis]|uniref:Uncharacterized protein n=2 Tax=Nitrososphaera viennensis TaxID=1034015 RepID=A0A060HN14_9ARCH|nr:hypothetical protein [Nitrososphaera viennensis]AIC14612.1 hypothetical protein NVIE_004190 [Nitrososphaera viennensis EN76]UVS69576.1 hypothetical protein NWT39_02035 [Nitrososphaera viennensis]